MRAKVRRAASAQALTRLLDAFAQELLEASDEEILEAARDLGMDLGMRWSAAFAGLMYPSAPQASDFFDLEALKSLPGVAGRDRIRSNLPVKSRSKSRLPGRRRSSIEKKPPNGK